MSWGGLFSPQNFEPRAMLLLRKAGFWFLKGLRGVRKPVGAVKAPTGPLTPGSGATTLFHGNRT